jgi:dinuclear metal center YbgI/SA1388 family protein
MISLVEAVDFCDGMLSPERFRDYAGAHNGLQLQNDGTVRKVAAAVDANLLAIRGAIEAGADLLIVHHGLFWGKTLPLVGGSFEKIHDLMRNNVALYSSHLPLDCHPTMGNNASILRLLAMERCGEVVQADHDFPMPVGDGGGRGRDAFRRRLLELFPGTRAMEYGAAEIHRVLVCSGGGGDTIAAMESIPFDAVVTGEAPRHFFDFACENRLNAYVCGHYATETFGVENLARALATKFSIPFQWIGEDCPL